MNKISIRFGNPSDIDSLLRFEKRYFPKAPGVEHAGFVFEDLGLATTVLSEEVASPLRMWTVVAEVKKEVVGFATATPWSLPGNGRIAEDSMLLQYLAVDPAHRRHGIASMLINEIERRAVSARQKIIIAKVPDYAEFYDANGWKVADKDSGYAWVPFRSMLKADVPDPEMGFPRIAIKELQPEAIRTTFSFPLKTDTPGLDAAIELGLLLDSKTIDARKLDADTLDLVNIARRDALPAAVRMIPKKLGAFGQEV